MSMNPSDPAPRRGAPLDPEAEYLRLLPELERLSTEKLLTINVDVIDLVTKVLGVLPKLRGFQAQLEASFAHFDRSLFERIESVAAALVEAQAIYNRTRSKAESVLPRVQELRKIRRRLLRLARALVDYGRIDASELARIGEKRSHLGLISDVLTLTAVLRGNWERVAGCTPLTLEMLAEPPELAVQLMEALGHRGETPPEFRKAVRIRQQLFTLLVRSYEQARAALRYLRAQQRDADRIAPSPYSGRRGRGVKSAGSCAEVEVTPTNTAPAETSRVEQVPAPQVESVPVERAPPLAASEARRSRRSHGRERRLRRRRALLRAHAHPPERPSLMSVPGAQRAVCAPDGTLAPAADVACAAQSFHH